MNLFLYNFQVWKSMENVLSFKILLLSLQVHKNKSQYHEQCNFSNLFKNNLFKAFISVILLSVVYIMEAYVSLKVYITGFNFIGEIFGSVSGWTIR